MSFLRELLKESKKQEKKALKPRATNLNAALTTKRGGKHYSPKTDYVRAKETSKDKREIHEAEGTKYYKYKIWYEVKDYGDDSGGDKWEEGVIPAASEEDAKAKCKKMHKRVYDIELTEVPESKFKEYADKWDD